jgi:hypothetical protein
VKFPNSIPCENNHELNNIFNIFEHAHFFFFSGGGVMRTCTVLVKENEEFSDL